MTEAIADFLLSPDGDLSLADADKLRAERLDSLAALTRLRKRTMPEIAAAAWDLSELRIRARVKFGLDAARMFFVRDALEQASGRNAAAYHARRFADVGIKTVTDLCGGIGGDALAFARAGLSVTLIERDTIRAKYAAANARACGLTVTVVVGDVAPPAPNSGGAGSGKALSLPTPPNLGAGGQNSAVWFDPARRTETRRRIVNPDDYSPPLSLVNSFPDAGVKLAPAVNRDIGDAFDAEIEWISDGGECKEAILWRGKLKTGDKKRATILTGDGPKILTGGETEARVGEIKRWLYEPDPAVIRSGLIGTLAEQLDARAIDGQIAYLTGAHQKMTPFADAYEILEWLPYRVKNVQSALEKCGAGDVVVKKRGIDLEPEAVRKQFKLSGKETLTLVLTRRGAQSLALICRSSPAYL